MSFTLLPCFLKSLLATQKYPFKRLLQAEVTWTANFIVCVYSRRKITAIFTLPLELDTWEAGGDRKTITQREREHNHFLVLYDVKQVQAAEVS
jgi:hypothetical protein